LNRLQTIWVMDFILFSSLSLTKLSLGLTKLSILFFYKKIFAISYRFRIIAWIAIVLSIVWTISFSFANICMYLIIVVSMCRIRRLAT
jgi:hypothetical protein